MLVLGNPSQFFYRDNRQQSHSLVAYNAQEKLGVAACAFIYVHGRLMASSVQATAKHLSV